MPVTQPKTNFISIGEVDPSIHPSSLALKLLISQAAITYFIQSITHSQVLFWGSYKLSYVESDTDLANRMERIFEKDELLQMGFSQKIIAIDSEYTLMPRGFFFPADSNERLYLSQIDKAAGIEIVFSVGNEVYNKLKSLFSNCVLVHPNSTFLKLLPNYLSGQTNRIFVNVDCNVFDVVYFNNAGTLQLMNRYRYTTETDFIYFLLLCCDELMLDRESIELVISGLIDTQSKIYDMCYRYFRHLTFIEPGTGITFSKAFVNFTRHQYFNLYNLSV